MPSNRIIRPHLEATSPRHLFFLRRPFAREMIASPARVLSGVPLSRSSSSSGTRGSARTAFPTCARATRAIRSRVISARLNFRICRRAAGFDSYRTRDRDRFRRERPRSWRSRGASLSRARARTPSARGTSAHVQTHAHDEMQLRTSRCACFVCVCVDYIRGA